MPLQLPLFSTRRALIAVAVFVMIAFGWLVWKSRKTPPMVGNRNLAPCPQSPNCVSSLANDPDQQVKPFQFSGDRAANFAELKQIIADMPQSKIVTAEEGYLHAEFRSKFFRFVDDFELLADEEAGLFHVRSSSRFGYSDLGVNRKRVEEIRKRFEQSAGNRTESSSPD